MEETRELLTGTELVSAGGGEERGLPRPKRFKHYGPFGLGNGAGESNLTLHTTVEIPADPGRVGARANALYALDEGTGRRTQVAGRTLFLTTPKLIATNTVGIPEHLHLTLRMAAGGG